MSARASFAILAFFLASPAMAQTPASPAGATSCSGCHPAGKSIDTPAPRLVGRAAPDIVAAMRAFRTGGRPATIMDRIAKGFSDDEIGAIAAWYAGLRD